MFRIKGFLAKASGKPISKITPQSPKGEERSLWTKNNLKITIYNLKFKEVSDTNQYNP